MNVHLGSWPLTSTSLYIQPIFWKPTQQNLQSSEWKGVKRQFFGPNKLQNHTNEGKRKEKKKEGEEEERGRREKSNGCTLSFYNGYIGDWREKKCWTEKDPFGRNVFKNPARHKMKKKKSIQCLNLSNEVIVSGDLAPECLWILDRFNVLRKGVNPLWLPFL